MSADEAYQDDIFDQTASLASESLVWALAKQSGKFEELLRNPAEGIQYEEEKTGSTGTVGKKQETSCRKIFNCLHNYLLKAKSVRIFPVDEACSHYRERHCRHYRRQTYPEAE